MLHNMYYTLYVKYDILSIWLWYNGVMSYEVGQFVDLSHLNGGVARVQKKSDETPQYSVGTQLRFRQTGRTFQMVRAIPVAFA